MMKKRKKAIDSKSSNNEDNHSNLDKILSPNDNNINNDNYYQNSIKLQTHKDNKNNQNFNFYFRTVEHHTYTPNGALLDRDHIDTGSSITIDIMLSEPGV